MPEQNLSILRLFSALGKDSADNMTLGYVSKDTSWRNSQVKLQVADIVARSLSDQGYDVYCMVNNTDRVLTGNERGTAADITQINALWADLDFKDSGLQGEDGARQVIAHLSQALNTPPTAIVLTGHGLHPYWDFDEEDGVVTDANRDEQASFLRRWGSFVQATALAVGGKVDSVFDLPRVLRAPGTVNHKSDPVWTDLELIENSHPITRAEVIEVLDEFSIPEAAVDSTPNVDAKPFKEWAAPEVSCLWASVQMDSIDKARFGGRHNTAVALATRVYAGARRGCLSASDLTAMMDLLEAKFLDALKRGEDGREPLPGEFRKIQQWAIAKVASMSELQVYQETDQHAHDRDEQKVPDLGKESGSDAPATALEVADKPAAPQGVQYKIESFPFTESANGRFLAARLAGEFIYVKGYGWLTWEDGRYVDDELNLLQERVQHIMPQLAGAYPTQEGMKWAKKSMSKGGLQSSLALAASAPSIAKRGMALDANLYELVTPGGIVNLRNSDIRPADPFSDFNTKSCMFTPKPGNMDRFMAFLRFAFGHDGEEACREYISYMQTILGAALIGEVRWQFLPMFVGTGANGKSTLLEVISRILGSYARTMPENFLLEGNQQHLTELANLQGVRLAIASETRPDGVFNESRVKQLTGGDKISARKMREDLFEFIPSHTLLIALNHKPMVRAGGDGFWRRMRIIDFKSRVPDNLRNDNLVSEIVEAEGPAILQWMIEGARRIIAHGENPPGRVLQSSADYQYEEDQMANFVSDNITLDDDAAVYETDLLNVYQAWASAENQDRLTGPQFKRELFQRMSSLRRTRDSSGRRMIAGIAVLNKAIKSTEQFNGAGPHAGGTFGTGDSGDQPRNWVD